MGGGQRLSRTIVITTKHFLSLNNLTTLSPCAVIEQLFRPYIRLCQNKFLFNVYIDIFVSLFFQSLDKILCCSSETDLHFSHKIHSSRGDGTHFLPGLYIDWSSFFFINILLHRRNSRGVSDNLHHIMFPKPTIPTYTRYIKILLDFLNSLSQWINPICKYRFFLV